MANLANRPVGNDTYQTSYHLPFHSDLFLCGRQRQSPSSQAHGQGMPGNRPSALVAERPLSTIASSTLMEPSSSSASFSASVMSAPSNLNQSSALHDPPTQIGQSNSNIPDNLPLTTLRSMSSMQGLLLAEMGDSMVELDVYGRPGGSGYRVGQRIEEGWVTPGGSSAMKTGMDFGQNDNLGKELWKEKGDIISAVKSNRKGTWSGSRRGRRKADLMDVGLSASDTLLQIHAHPRRSTSDLRTLLGNSNRRLKPNARLMPRASIRKAASTGNLATEFLSPSPVALEKAKTRARVEVDIVLESETCVQGGWIKGLVKVHIRKPTKKNQLPLLLSVPKAKVRVVGFECIPHESTRCTFYQCTAPLSDVAPSWRTVLSGQPDDEGWAMTQEGVHVFPFAMLLPADGSCGTAKGILSVHSGVELRYVAMVSLKLKDPVTSEQSVAHFYRDCEIWPRLSLSTSLSAASRPLVSEATKGVLFGGPGKVKLTAKLHRLHWIAGQRCAVYLCVANESKKHVKSANIALVRTTTVFKPTWGAKGGHDDTDPDACETMTMTKVVASSVLAMGQKCSKGHASAKGWWTGVKPGQTTEFVHQIAIPSDALTIARVRLLEVEYTLRISVSTGGLSSDVHVTLPIRIINFLSLDPPPTSPQMEPRKKNVPTKPHKETHEMWYRKTRSNIGSIIETEETIPGMKYSNKAMTVEAPAEVPDESIVMNTTDDDLRHDDHVEPEGPEIRKQRAEDNSTDSVSVYPASQSAATITVSHAPQRTSALSHDSRFQEGLDEIDQVIGTDSRIRHFVTGTQNLDPTGSQAESRPRGPRLDSRSSPSKPIAPLIPQAESTPPKRHAKFHTFADRVQEKLRSHGVAASPVKPFVKRTPNEGRAAEGIVMRAGVGGQENSIGRAGSALMGVPTALPIGSRSANQFAMA